MKPLVLILVAGCLSPLTTVAPAETQDDGRVQAVTAGARHACALLDDGGARCWGAAGLVGDGTKSLRVRPVDVALDQVAELAVGYAHTCALTRTGSVYCWGQNQRGELGLGDTEPRLQPTLVEGLDKGITRIAANASHTCVLHEGGHAFCWGVNDQYQLGAGAGAESSTPVAVADLAAGARDISPGAGHTCIVHASGQVHCWGANTHGELGIGSMSSTPVAKPQRVLGLPEPMMMVRSGRFHTCAVSTLGEVWCWGQGERGALGDDTSLDHALPVRAKLPGVAVDLAASEGGTCAVVENGDTYCWGRNDSGQLGDGSRIPRPAPVLVAGLTSRRVAAGSFFTCAATRQRRALCWGKNDEGQLGDGTDLARDTPTAVNGL